MKQLKTKYLKKLNLIVISERSLKWVVNKILIGFAAYIIATFPKLKSLYRLLRNYKKSIINPRPYVINALKLSNNLKVTHKGKRFYQFF